MRRATPQPPRFIEVRHAVSHPGYAIVSSLEKTRESAIRAPLGPPSPPRTPHSQFRAPMIP